MDSILLESGISGNLTLFKTIESVAKNREIFRRAYLKAVVQEIERLSLE